MVDPVWVRVSLPWATFGLAADFDQDGMGRVVEAAPIAAWAIGKPAPYVLGYFRHRGATVHRLAGNQPQAGRT
jgi:hypothetical protein